jgi:TolB-like protein/DNA-binding winged helix-turn-helix (wHTH) protein/Flp pilus assembly protein TadD
MVERNAGLPPDKRIEFRVGVHLGDVVEEADGDVLGDGVNIAVRIGAICKPGGVCLSGAAYEQVRDRVKEAFVDLGEKQLKNIARPIRAYEVTLNRQARASEFTFGSFRLFPDQQLLLDGETPVPLGSRAREILLALVERPGVVVTRDELFARGWPRQVVEESNLKFQVSLLRKALGDDQLGNRFITNIPGRGYCFVAPVESSDRKLASPARAKPDAPVEDTSGRVDSHEAEFAAERKPPLLESPPEKSAPPRLSIVVLPFANIGGDPEQDYFADGVTENLTTDLSRMRGAFVIGRNTAFTYKGKVIDLKQIGRELNVRYILEGSVQRAGTRIRVNVQLIDAESGNHLWAERFDSPVVDLLDMQDDIVSRLARQLDVELIAAEARRAELSPNPDSFDLYFRGKASFNKGLTPEDLSNARDFFERALVLDRGNLDAQVGTAAVDVVAANTYQIKDQRSRLAAAEKALTTVLLCAPNHAYAHFLMGMTLTLAGRPAQGVAECERALALDKNLAAARAFIGLTKLRLGRVEETEADVRAALSISPRDKDAFAWIAYLAGAKLYLGEYEEAAAEYRRSQEYNRNHPLVYFYLGAALALAGHIDEAKAEVREGLNRVPDFTIRSFRAGTLSDNRTYLAQRERLYDGLRKAGVPEG